MRLKLHDHKSDEPRLTLVSYSLAPLVGRPPLASFDSLETDILCPEPPLPPFAYALCTEILNVNTPEQFVGFSAAAAAGTPPEALITHTAISKAITDETFFANPAKVCPLFAYSYADLKRLTVEFRVNAPTVALADGRLLSARKFTAVPMTLHDALIAASMSFAVGDRGRGRPLAFVASAGVPASLFDSAAGVAFDATQLQCSPFDTIQKNPQLLAGVDSGVLVIADFSSRPDSTSTVAQNILTALFAAESTKSLATSSGIRVILLRERNATDGVTPSVAVTVELVSRQTSSAPSPPADRTQSAFVVKDGWLTLRTVPAAPAGSQASEGDADGASSGGGGSVKPLTSDARDGHVNLAAVLDKASMVTAAAELNLTLMTWQALPQLQLQKLRSTRVLLVGAGTLGCHVARQLIQWGISSITFIDNGVVAPSNPARQNLYWVEDVGKPKAAAAAASLARLHPPCVTDAKGVRMTVPMPGHPVGDTSTIAGAAAVESVEQLDALVRENDVVFLLTDSREARWLPTVAAAAHGRLAISTALGFDTWMTVRHAVGDCTGGGDGGCDAASAAAAGDVGVGGNVACSAGGSGDGGSLLEASHPSSSLGCYFCHDIAAPSNTIKDRTLDKACTVTRPAASAIASAVAVELFVTLLHHPDGAAAPAPAVDVSADIFAAPSDSPLGHAPHLIRGHISGVNIVSSFARRSGYCPACSLAVVDMYRKDKGGFVVDVCNDSILTRITGADKLMEQFEEAAKDIIELDEDEWE